MASNTPSIDKNLEKYRTPVLHNPGTDKSTPFWQLHREANKKSWPQRVRDRWQYAKQQADYLKGDVTDGGYSGIDMMNRQARSVMKHAIKPPMKMGLRIGDFAANQLPAQYRDSIKERLAAARDWSSKTYHDTMRDMTNAETGKYQQALDAFKNDANPWVRIPVAMGDKAGTHSLAAAGVLAPFGVFAKGLGMAGHGLTRLGAGAMSKVPSLQRAARAVGYIGDKMVGPGLTTGKFGFGPGASGTLTKRLLYGAVNRLPLAPFVAGPAVNAIQRPDEALNQNKVLTRLRQPLWLSSSMSPIGHRLKTFNAVAPEYMEAGKEMLGTGIAPLVAEGLRSDTFRGSMQAIGNNLQGMDAEKAKKIWKRISEDPNIAPAVKGVVYSIANTTNPTVAQPVDSGKVKPADVLLRGLQSPEVREVMKESLRPEKLDALGNTVVDVAKKKLPLYSEEVEGQVERAKDAVEAGMDGNYGPLRDVAGDVKKKIGEIPRTPMEMLIWWDKAPIEDKVKIIHSAGDVLGKVMTKEKQQQQ